MTREEFKYWITGYLHLSSETFLVHHQVNVIKNHANLVMVVAGCIDEKISMFIDLLDKNVESTACIPIIKLRELVSVLEA